MPEVVSGPPRQPLRFSLGTTCFFGVLRHKNSAPHGPRRELSNPELRVDESLWNQMRDCLRNSYRERKSNNNNTERQIMKLDTLKKLYVSELRDLYNAENQLLKALPKMAKAASSEELKDGFEKHLEQTKGHVERLEQIFEGLDENPKGKTCKAMKGLIEEGSEILKEDGEESVLDAGIIVAAQKVEHYEMAGYGSVRTFAQLLGQNKAAELLQTTLDEESETNEILNKLAEGVVNPEALRETELADAASNR
jgi:ferritin-like metal-binding protein YciE